jgi:membrane fusion protein
MDFMSRESLFRTEVLARKKFQHFGTVSINVPLRAALVTGGLAIFIVLLAFFFIFASFSEKSVARGYLNSTKGIVRIYPLKNGTIKTCKIHQGQLVKKGDPLFLIDTSATGLDPKHSDLELGNLLKKQQAIEVEVAYKKQEIAKLKHLLDKHFIPLSLYHQKKEALFLLENSKNALEIELLHYRQSQSYWVRAPLSGTLSAVLFHRGELVNSTQILAKLLPENAQMLAEIFVPIQQAGFLKQHGPVILQYDAYPSVHFGSQKAEIIDISQSILTDAEEVKPFLMRGPYYKVTAKLAAQNLNLYGKERPLLHGMTFNAFIMGEKKALWQWVFDPVFNRYGKLTA